MLSRLTVAAVLVLGACALAEPDVATMYDVTTDGTTAKLKAGERGKVVISIHARNGAHVSDEAPLKIELSSKESKLEKEKLTLSDSLNRKKEGDTEYPDPRFEVAFTPTAQGKTTVSAKMTFFICSEKLCARQTKTLTFPVEVN